MRRRDCWLWSWFVGVALVMPACALSTSCVSSSYSYGQKFDETKIGLIRKGETTTKQIAEWFGQPVQKHTLSDNEEKWIYMHMEGVATASGFGGAKTKGKTKTLDLFIRDEIIMNYAYNVSDDAMGVNE